MEKVDILIKNATIFTMDPENQIIEDGFISIVGTDIVQVGKQGDQFSEGYSKRTIDARGNPILPGFVNTHHHFFSTYFRGSPYMHGEGDLLDFIKNVYSGGIMNANREDCYYAVLLGCMEMMKSGITSCIDVNGWTSLAAAEAALDAFQDAGIRGTEARLVVDQDPLQLGLVPGSEVSTALDETVDLIEKWEDHDRIRVWFHPTMPYQCSDELLGKISDLSRELDVGFSIHLHEEKTEIESWIENTGLSPIKYYYEKGIDILNERNIATHCVWLDDEEIDILKKTNTAVSHNAVINLHSAGIAPVPKLLAAGITVGLGTDDAFGDMFEVMKTTALVHKLPAGNSSVILPDKILEMATIDGARVMRLDDQVGSIQAGKKADLVMLDLHHPNTTPITSPLSYLIVYCAKANNVDTVIINGEIILRNGSFVSLDEKNVIEKTQRSLDRMLRSN